MFECLNVLSCCLLRLYASIPSAIILRTIRLLWVISPVLPIFDCILETVIVDGEDIIDQVKALI